MYLLNERQSKIILDLVGAEAPITAKVLSDKYNVSIRTIRYDMEIIDAWLEENQIILMKKQRVGFWLSITQIEKAMIRDKLKVSDSTIKILSKDERKKLIIRELLINSRHVNSHYFSEILGVSKTTILLDINDIREDLKSKDIFIEGKTGVGYIIKGDEKNIRKLIGNMLSNDLDSNQLLEMLNKDSSSNAIFNVLKENISLDMNAYIGEIKHAIKKSKEIFDFWIPDSSYISLILHIAIAIDRLKNNQNIVLSSEKINLLQTYKEYILAKEISIELEKVFNISIPEAEVANITFHLISANLKLNYLKSENIYDVNLSRAIDEIMEYLRSKLVLPESGFEKLKMDLLSHFKLSIKKMELNISSKNPLLEQIKEDYRQFYEIAERVVSIFFNSIGKSVKLDAHEISYVTLYIAAQCEIHSQKIFKNVLVVCTTGKGLAKILSAKLEKYFTELFIKDTVSLFDLEEGSIVLDDIDFIISTLEISNVDVPVLKVSPMLTERDIAIIKNCIYTDDAKKMQKSLFTDSKIVDYQTNKENNINFLYDIQLNHIEEETALIMADIGMLLEELKEHLNERDIIPKIWSLAIHIIMAIPRWRNAKSIDDLTIDDLTLEQQKIYTTVSNFLEEVANRYKLNISGSEKLSFSRYFFKEVVMVEKDIN